MINQLKPAEATLPVTAVRGFVLVSLVSEQTIPNILVIHHFRPRELLFIITPSMVAKGKPGHILRALSLLGLNYDRNWSAVEVPEDSVPEIHRALQDWHRGRDTNDSVLNLTGGTKIMAIAAYEFFRGIAGKIVYVPYPRNEFIIPFSKESGGDVTSLSLRLKVPEYLAACGLRLVSEGKMKSAMRDAIKRGGFSEWITHHYAEVKPLLEKLGTKLRRYREYREGHLLEVALAGAGDGERELLLRAGFAVSGDEYSRNLTMSEIRFLTGGWLEEYCYNRIASLLGKGVDDVLLGVQIVNSHTRDNEFDVMFTGGNTLYIVECKSLDQNDDPRAEALYKIAALQQEFGLRVESFFVSTSPHIMRDGVLKASVAARAEQFNTTVITPDRVRNFAAELSRRFNRSEVSPFT